MSPDFPSHARHTMSCLPCCPREERLPPSEVLNRALELCVQGDFRSFSSLVDLHHVTVLQAYDDFFFVGTEINVSRQPEFN